MLYYESDASEASENEESGDDEGEPTGGCSAAEQKLGREAVDAELGRPAAWGQGYADYVTKEDQEPCKPRGRKPKQGKKAPAKKGTKGKAEEEESEEMEAGPVETKKRKSKARSAKASKKARKDAAVEVEHEPARVRRVRAKAKASPKTRPAAKGKAKAKAKPAAKAGPKTKAKSAGSKYRSPCLDDSSYKAKQSRKSSAYHRAMKEARDEGLDEDLCKLRAREVPT